MWSPNTYHLTKISEKVLTHGVNIASSLLSKKSIILQIQFFRFLGITRLVVPKVPKQQLRSGHVTTSKRNALVVSYVIPSQS